ncbi:MAG: radical SAM protein [Bacteroidetes bacterium]|nr:radical SAM protein [Bacteroidota bacterium]MBL7103397.1 radical SAM protein [Bacteroidales bacterium]
MKQKHFNIPLFIPELACPFQCIYCNQKKISGRLKVPSAEEINKIVEEHLRTIPEKCSRVELAFFGGNFTGLQLNEQEAFLKLVQRHIKTGRISGIRLSTRPDYINEEVLKLLKRYNVKTIELGAQSMDDGVLKLSKRGHTVRDTETASAMILRAGFSLGLQIMIGLPGDTLEKSVFTAEKIIEIGADNTRIYPALVIKDTKMEKMYKEGKYQPLTLKEAVKWSKKLLLIFEKANVKVIRLGLHPSEGLLSGEELVAGPFHPSFRELVLTEIWNDLLKPLLDSEKSGEIEIHVPPGQLNYAIGYEGRNKKMLLGKYQQVKFCSDQELTGREYKFRLFVSFS